MDESSKFYLIIVQSAIIGILLIYLVFSIGDTGRMRAMEGQIVMLQEHMAECLERNDSLSLQLQYLRIEHAIPPFLDLKKTEYLREQGLAHPVKEIRNDLIASPGLIARPGVLGGEMGFYFRDGIHILNHRWVFAYFEDGHVEGAMLLRFEIGDDGNIEWQVLDETSFPG